MFKICIIGCGEIATNFHGPAIKKYLEGYPGAVFAACCDSDISKAKAFAGKYNCGSFYSDYKEMIQKEQPDAVSITAPYSVIPAIACDVMGLGIPVMMEKPPGASRSEVLSIMEVAEKGGVLNQVAFNRRFTPIVNELRKMLNEAAAKDGIYNIRCVFQRVGRRDNDFYTTAIHGIDTVRYIAGSDYEQVCFRYQELPDINSGAANIYLDGVMKSKTAVQLAFVPVGGKVIEDYFVTCRNHDFSLQMPVWGSPEYPGGIVHFSGNERSAYVKGDDSRFGLEMFEKFGFYEENANFFNAVRTGKAPGSDISSALQSVEIAECIRQRQTEYKRL